MAKVLLHLEGHWYRAPGNGLTRNTRLAYPYDTTDRGFIDQQLDVQPDLRITLAPLGPGEHPPTERILLWDTESNRWVASSPGESGRTDRIDMACRFTPQVLSDPPGGIDRDRVVPVPVRYTTRRLVEAAETAPGPAGSQPPDAAVEALREAQRASQPAIEMLFETAHTLQRLARELFPAAGQTRTDSDRQDPTE